MTCPEKDSLTGLLTRGSFHEQARSINDGGLAVVWFNLDNFKMFNKRFGFERGDDILREIALILGSTFSHDTSGKNLLARFSDDNFVVLTDWATVEMNIDTVQEYLYSLHENSGPEYISPQKATTYAHPATGRSWRATQSARITVSARACSTTQ